MNKRAYKILLIITLIMSILTAIGVGIALGFYDAILSTGFDPTALLSILGTLSLLGMFGAPIAYDLFINNRYL